MKPDCLLDVSQSAYLRVRLENHLITLFSSGLNVAHILIREDYPVADLVSACDLKIDSLPHLKLAYQLWTGMRTSDRKAVLQKFQELCLNAAPYSLKQPLAILFCVIFVRELTTILADTMDWPD